MMVTNNRAYHSSAATASPQKDHHINTNIMKIKINSLVALSALVLLLWGCEKDEEKLMLKIGQPPVLSATADELVLTVDEVDNDAVTLNWDAVDFGYDAAVLYTLEIDTAENNFATPFNVALGSSPMKTFKVGELNNLLLRLKYGSDVAHDVPMRIKATVSGLVDPVYSNTHLVKVTPYSTVSYIYVPGAYQGWNPGSAPALRSLSSNGIYEGIISFFGDNQSFKFTANRNWDLNYGGGDGAGTLAEGGADLSVPTADSYRLTADLNNLTWSHELYSWGIIGDATPGGWDADTNLTYDAEQGVWKITTPLTPGKIKFRLNNEWGTNYGDDDTSNNVLNASGADISVASGGNYLITLNLEAEDGIPTYSITKQ